MLLKSFTDLGFETWVTKVKEILHANNLSHLYDVSYVDDSSEMKIIRNLKKSLYCSFAETCMKDLYQYPSLRSYVLLKQEYKLENYLFVIRDYKLRKSISKLRLSSHELMIEKGRYTKPKVPAEKRLCKCCTTGSVENEMHFLLECPAFSLERCYLLQTVHEYEVPIIDDNQRNFCQILSCVNEKVMFAVGKYINKCFVRRKEILMQ